jgi:hypothetical protein
LPRLRANLINHLNLPMKTSLRSHHFTLRLLAFYFVAAPILAKAATGPAAPTFGPKWSSLAGEWKSEGASGPSGICGFHFDLARHVIVRTNHAELSTGAAVHEDLTIIYPDPAPDKAKAIYFDNEGHVIDYSAEWSADGNTLTFMSKPGPGPQFRLIYKNAEPEVLTVSFEMAPPSQPGAFKPYTSGKIRRSGK